MMKRVIETNGIFGVMLPPCLEDGGVIDHGTMVKITGFEPLLSCDIIPTIEGNLPRYVVQVTGLNRFKVQSSRLCDGGYHEGLASRIEDFEVDGDPNWEPKELETLVTLARFYVKSLFESLPECTRVHFEKKHGPMPSCPSDLSFWLADFLPLHPYTLYQIMPMTRVIDRLKLLCQWMEMATNNQMQPPPTTQMTCG